MMKIIIPFLSLGALHATAQTASYVNFIRQNQLGAGVVWDMPVEAVGAAPSALTLENGGALFQLWTFEQTVAKDYLLDQKLVGAYLPTADIEITTLDPDSKIPRTRVDQPFNVEINITGLLTGLGFPQAASMVLLERHLGSYEADQTALNPAVTVSGPPFTSAYLSENGKTVLTFSASALTAADPTKAAGEEHFVVHALSDGKIEQSQIASGFVQVWPVASGSIKGIATGDQLRSQSPEIKMLLNDLYPRSDTYLLLFEGTQISGVEGEIVKTFPVDGESCVSTVIGVTELDPMITQDGTYTLVLASDTVYGRELLCKPVTFSVNRTQQATPTQVNVTDGPNP